MNQKEISESSPDESWAPCTLFCYRSVIPPTAAADAAAEFALIKFSVKSKSDPNVYVWSRIQVQKGNLLIQYCNH